MRESSFGKFHPWVILAYLTMVLMITMCSRHPVMILFSFVSSFCYSVYLIGWKVWKRTAICGLSIAVFAVFLMPLFYHNGVTPLFYVNGLAVTKECVVYGSMMTVMLLSALQWFFVWDRLLREDQILYLIGRVMPGLALLLTMSLRFVPLLVWRMREIRDSRTGLGDRRGRHSFGDAMRDLSVLLSWSLEDSMETSIAMESRGYGLKRRSSFHLFHWRSRDGIALPAMLALFLIVIVQLWAGAMPVSYFPAIHFEQNIRHLSLCGIPYLLLASAPMFYDSIQQMLQRKSPACTGNELKERERAYLEQWYRASGTKEVDQEGERS